jgi:coenzyme F420-0:L-glutamate ligase
MNIFPIKTSLFKKNDNLIDFIYSHISKLSEGDIIAITSKIVALSQGAIIPLSEKNNHIYKNSKKVIKTPWALLALVDGEWRINAGADESNADKNVILLPKNPGKIAQNIRNALIKRLKIKHLGVLMTDTRSVPLRKGTIGRAIGYAGFDPIKSYINKKDLFGRKSRHTESNIADALAASAVLVMGEGNEQIPLAVIKGALVHFLSAKKSINLSLSPQKDIYAAVFK